MILERKCLKFAVVFLALVIDMPGTAEVWVEPERVKHSFTYFYADGKGDYYKGSFYAFKGEYNPIKKYYWTDENGARGYYAITKTETISDYYKSGVYISSYYDKETNKTFTFPERFVGHGLGNEQCNVLDTYISEDKYDFFGFKKNSLVKYEADFPELWKNYFTFTYGNGDFYKGYVYAESSYGYRTGNKQYYTDSNRQKGYYTITGGIKIGTIQGYDSRVGQVYVTQYFDKETNKFSTPMAKGSNYLGSEWGHMGGFSECWFGNRVFDKVEKIVQEADWPILYKNYFRFDYGNGDFYTGFVYAASTWGYRNGKIYYVTDENGGKAKYTITGGDKIGYIWAADSRLGKVYISQYYDAESNKSYGLVNPGAVKGSYYLGSESGHIIADTDARYLFGSSSHYEADLTAPAPPVPSMELWKNYFTYTYGNGDKYNGYVYALSSYGYRNGKQYYNTDENGQLGVYTITGGAKIGSVSSTDARIGKVYVDTYLDKESNKPYTPIKPTEVKGWNYLGSEYGYIVKEFNEELMFGQYGHFNHVEADIPILYKNYFRYNFSNGDIYYGYVYALSSYGYRNGKVYYKTDENGGCGYYTITGGADPEAVSPDDSRLGKVVVTKYYDIESNRTFVPLNLSGQYLGEEKGVLFRLSSGEDANLYFGSGVEADIPVLYKNYFTFYHVSGDSYKGYVYALSSYGYRNGNKYYSSGTYDNCGYYEITAGTNPEAIFPTESRMGKVYVTSYYNKESDRIYSTCKSANPAEANGNKYLGSENGYMFSSSSYKAAMASDVGKKYYFGNDLDWSQRNLESDLPIIYKKYFTFTYTNGDYYKGYVYAEENNALAINSINVHWPVEDGPFWAFNCYKINSEEKLSTTSYSDSRFGKVLVTHYFDKERNKNYPILSQTSGKYLGSETGFIYRLDSLACRFGSFNKLHHEADAGYGYYYFNYYYDDGSGDYCKGVLKEISGLMKVGSVLRGTEQPMGNETIKGHYLITKYEDLGEIGSSKPGERWITGYYDGATKKWSNTFSVENDLNEASNEITNKILKMINNNIVHFATVEKIYKENSPESFLNRLARLNYDKTIIAEVNKIYTNVLSEITLGKNFLNQAKIYLNDDNAAMAESYVKKAELKIKTAKSEYDRALTYFSDGVVVSQWKVVAGAVTDVAVTIITGGSGVIVGSIISSTVNTLSNKIGDILTQPPYDINRYTLNESFKNGYKDFIVSLVANLAGGGAGIYAKNAVITSPKFNLIVNKLAYKAANEQVAILKYAAQKAALAVEKLPDASKGAADKITSTVLDTMWDAVNTFPVR